MIYRSSWHIFQSTAQMEEHASTSLGRVAVRQPNSCSTETSSPLLISCEICKGDRAYISFFPTSASDGEDSSNCVSRSRNCQGQSPLTSWFISVYLRFNRSICPGGVQGTADQGAVLASARSFAFDVCPREEYVAPGENATKVLTAPLLTPANVSRC